MVFIIESSFFNRKSGFFDRKIRIPEQEIRILPLKTDLMVTVAGEELTGRCVAHIHLIRFILNRKSIILNRKSIILNR